MTVLTSLLPCSRAPRTLARCDARLVCLLLVFCPPSDSGERLSSCPTIGSFLQNSWWKMFLMPNMHWMTHLYAQGCWLHQGAATDFWGTTFLYRSNMNLLILFFFKQFVSFCSVCFSHLPYLTAVYPLSPNIFWLTSPIAIVKFCNSAEFFLIIYVSFEHWACSFTMRDLQLL